MAAAPLCSAVLHAVVSLRPCSALPLGWYARPPDWNRLLSQPRGPGRGALRLVLAGADRRPVPACPCPPLARPGPPGEPEPHQRPPGQPRPGPGRRLPQRRRGQPEHADERAGRGGDGGRRGRRARLAGLAVLGGEGRRPAHDRVLQLQPQPLPAGDEHPPPHVPVSLPPTATAGSRSSGRLKPVFTADQRGERASESRFSGGDK